MEHLYVEPLAFKSLLGPITYTVDGPHEWLSLKGLCRFLGIENVQHEVDKLRRNDWGLVAKIPTRTESGDLALEPCLHVDSLWRWMGSFHADRACAQLALSTRERLMTAIASRGTPSPSRVDSTPATKLRLIQGQGGMTTRVVADN